MRGLETLPFYIRGKSVEIHYATKQDPGTVYHSTLHNTVQHGRLWKVWKTDGGEKHISSLVCRKLSLTPNNSTTSWTVEQCEEKNHFKFESHIHAESCLKEWPKNEKEWNSCPVTCCRTVTNPAGWWGTSCIRASQGSCGRGGPQKASALHSGSAALRPRQSLWEWASGSCSYNWETRQRGRMTTQREFHGECRHV